MLVLLEILNFLLHLFYLAALVTTYFGLTLIKHGIRHSYQILDILIVNAYILRKAPVTESRNFLKHFRGALLKEMIEESKA